MKPYTVGQKNHVNTKGGNHMAITDLIPWKRNESSVPVRRRQENDSLLDFRSQMNRLFDDFFERPFGLSPFFDECTGSGIK